MISEFLYYWTWAILSNYIKDLTNIARLIHVNDLNLTSLDLVYPCHTCSVYAMKQLGHPPEISRHFWIFLKSSDTFDTVKYDTMSDFPLLPHGTIHGRAQQCLLNYLKLGGPCSSNNLELGNIYRLPIWVPWPRERQKRSHWFWLIHPLGGLEKWGGFQFKCC